MKAIIEVCASGNSFYCQSSDKRLQHAMFPGQPRKTGYFSSPEGAKTAMERIAELQFVPSSELEFVSTT